MATVAALPAVKYGDSGAAAAEVCTAISDKGDVCLSTWIGHGLRLKA